MNKVQLPVIITPSRAELGLRCHRRHVLSDILQRAKYRSASLEFGSVIHAGAAAFWLGNDPISAVSTEWHQRIESQPEVSQKNISLSMAISMMEHYVENAQLAGPLTGSGTWKLVQVEERYEVPFKLQDGKPAVISFQIDRLVSDHENDRLVIVDSKTAGRLDQRWRNQWELSLQMKLYKALVRQVFHNENVEVAIEGILKDVPSKIEYALCPDWSKKQLSEAVMGARNVAEADYGIVAGPQGVRTVSEVEELAVAYTQFNYGDCHAYNLECPFRPICVSDVDERAGILRSDYFEVQEESY